MLGFNAACLLLPFLCERENIQGVAHAVKTPGCLNVFENVNSQYLSKVYTHKGCSGPQLLLILPAQLN